MLRYVVQAISHGSFSNKQLLKNQHPGMTRHGDGVSPADPLRASMALPFHHVLYPFGFTTHIKSNEPAIVRAAEQSWAPFAQRFREKPIEVRFLVSDFP